MDSGSPRKIQFTVPLLDSHLDPEAAEQIRRRRPTPATLVASSDQSSPEIDEDRLSNHLYKQALLNSPRQRRKGAKGTPTMKELQFLVDHHLHRQQQRQQGAPDESSESCLSERTSPDNEIGPEELPQDEESRSRTEQRVSLCSSYAVKWMSCPRRVYQKQQEELRLHPPETTPPSPRQQPNNKRTQLVTRPLRDHQPLTTKPSKVTTFARKIKQPTVNNPTVFTLSHCFHSDLDNLQQSRIIDQMLIH
ncbi:protein phosphatase 1 regulatory subunit 1A-like isoform X2 [Hoplias malabaricus]|uniref:protein phosphatase 1 regulatory subunit 1A-like isoform X2 n=1 Tax=Hoplias malabaricus TaxID=27720 RepID=UPI003461F667